MKEVTVYRMCTLTAVGGIITWTCIQGFGDAGLFLAGILGTFIGIMSTPWVWKYEDNP